MSNRHCLLDTLSIHPNPAVATLRLKIEPIVERLVRSCSRQNLLAQHGNGSRFEKFPCSWSLQLGGPVVFADRRCDTHSFSHRISPVTDSISTAKCTGRSLKYIEASKLAGTSSRLWSNFKVKAKLTGNRHGIIQFQN